MLSALLVSFHVVSSYPHTSFVRWYLSSLFSLRTKGLKAGRNVPTNWCPQPMVVSPKGTLPHEAPRAEGQVMTKIG